MLKALFSPLVLAMLLFVQNPIFFSQNSSPPSGGGEGGTFGSIVLDGDYDATTITGVSCNASLTTWYDLTSNHYNLHVGGGTPKYVCTSPINSGPAVQFFGSDWMDGAATHTSANPLLTIFAVYYINPSGSSVNGMVVGSNCGGNCQFGADSSSGNFVTFMAGGSAGFGSAAAVSTVYVVEYALDLTPGTSRICVNGTVCTTFSMNGAPLSDDMRIGTSGATNSFLTGYVARAQHYIGKASTADAQTVGGGLCTEFGVTGCGTTW